MIKLRLEKIARALEEGGVDQNTIERVKSVIESLEPETFDKAIIFLGWSTIILAIGSILLTGLGKPVPEALWSALGAGIGGLAGIFMGKQ